MAIYQPTFASPQNVKIPYDKDNEFSFLANCSSNDGFTDVDVHFINLDTGEDLGVILQDHNGSYGWVNGDTISLTLPANTLARGNYQWYVRLYSSQMETNEEVISPKYQVELTYSPDARVEGVDPIVKEHSKYFYVNGSVGDFAYYIFYLYDKDGYVVNQSPKLNNGHLEYEFDRLVSGNTYQIGVSFYYQDGTMYSTDKVAFDVDYEVSILSDSILTVETVCDKPAIRVEWGNAIVANAVADERDYEFLQNVPYTDGTSLKINKGKSVSWDLPNTDITHDFTLFTTWGAVEESFQGEVLRLELKDTELLDITNIPPILCNYGDNFFNTSDNKVYTCIETNVWSTYGYEPSITRIYVNKVDNVRYLWNGTKFNPTTNIQEYKVSYDKGKFYYDITNGDTTNSGHFMVQDFSDKWLLQIKDFEKGGVAFMWEDTANWEDTLFWSEPLPYITRYWFKIALLPNGVQVKPILR